MKKILLTASAIIIAATSSVKAQHLALYEEFTGENCPPCYSTNGPLWTLVTAAGNEDKVLLIRYQNKIPSATNTNGIYLKQIAQTQLVEQRRTYYSSTFSPQAYHDGYKYYYPQDPSVSGHAALLDQQHIDSMSAVAAPLNIEVVSFRFSTNNDSIYTTVKVTAPAAYAPTNGNLKLRVAFTQTLDYSSAADQGCPNCSGTYKNPTGLCGTNKENIFENVVRQMLPDAAGTVIPNTWTANQVQTYTLGAKLLSHITHKEHDKNPRIVAFVQNDANKSVLNTAMSAGGVHPTNVAPLAKGISNVELYPNPANSDVTLRMSIGEASEVSVTVFDLVGRVVYTAPATKLIAGTHKMNIPASNFVNGNYSVVLTAGKETVSQQLSVIK